MSTFLHALLGLMLAAMSAITHGAGVRSNYAEAELVTERAAVVPGQVLHAGLLIKLDREWHVYWKNPGDSGMPPALAWTLPEGYSAGEMQFPVPMRLPAAHLVNFGHDGEVLFPVEVQVPQNVKSGSAVRLAARAEWLECRESCLPAAADLTLDLPVAREAEDSRWAVLFRTTRAKLPTPMLPGDASAKLEGESVVISIPALARCAGGDFFPEQENVFVHARIVKLPGSTDAARYRLPLDAKAPAELSGVATCVNASAPISAVSVIVGVAGADGSDERKAQAATANALSLGLALAFALAGGLLLNLMPCVFPVLGLKVLGLAHGAQAAAPARALHAAAFVAGVLATFLALAGLLLTARAAGEQLGWGFQLQSPWVVAALSVLFFLLALNLSGLYEWGFRTQALAGEAAARVSGPFFDGVLAAAIASPCTAPFMGAALGYTLSQPTIIVLAVFAALALGMAAPYALLALAPRWVHRLPRPGPWMETAKRVLALPLYATVAWLAWVLAELSGMRAVAGLCAMLAALAMAIWLWRQRGVRALPRFASTGALALALAWLAHGIGSPDTPAPPSAASLWQPYSSARFATLRAQGRTVFIDFTAAWCVTCQVNKHAVLHTERVAGAFRAADAVTLRADWTRRDPEITGALAALGRNGVPVYVLYGPAGRVTILPELLTTDIVLQALQGIRL